MKLRQPVTFGRRRERDGYDGRVVEGDEGDATGDCPVQGAVDLEDAKVE